MVLLPADNSKYSQIDVNYMGILLAHERKNAMTTLRSLQYSYELNTNRTFTFGRIARYLCEGDLKEFIPSAILIGQSFFTAVRGGHAIHFIIASIALYEN